jgi:hypothetical protein
MLEAPFRTPVQQSDFFRHAVLYRHGGVYFDLDVLFLKPIRIPGEWAYEWSLSNCANTALLQLRSGSETASKLIGRGIRIGSFYPMDLYRYNALREERITISVHPCEWFDPAWKTHDSGVTANDYCNCFDDFFGRDVEIERFFPNSYCYHWHNRWDRSISARSTAGRFWREHVSRMLGTDLAEFAPEP